MGTPAIADLRHADFTAHKMAVRSLLQTLFVDRCMSRPDPVAAAQELLMRERDAFDGIAGHAIGEVEPDYLKHLVLEGIETLLQSVAREVAVRVEKGRPPS